MKIQRNWMLKGKCVQWILYLWPLWDHGTTGEIRSTYIQWRCVPTYCVIGRKEISSNNPVGQRQKSVRGSACGGVSYLTAHLVHC